MFTILITLQQNIRQCVMKLTVTIKMAQLLVSWSVRVGIDY